jgi:hypothetical protein
MFYMIMWVETLCGRTFSFMRNVEPASRVGHVVNDVRMRPPHLDFSI